MYVIGTAGHVDHGKSTLVEALTGIDPDRLAEEKAREMTIDLGFAWMILGEDEEVGVVDVPGHRDFIENMLAGVGGIDLALFVVAADEGVMPQTKEHLAILDLLEVHGGVVALTKVDLIDDQDWLELVTLDLEETLTGTVLEDSPVVQVSARTGQGIAELKRLMWERLQATPARPNKSRPRLPVDRVFSLSGFGTVVTGTLLDGRLRTGDQIEVQPSGHKGRIRGLQTHNTKRDIAQPGSRVAVNLTGFSRDEIKRGDVISMPGSLNSTILLDVAYRHLPDAGTPLKHDMEVKLFVGATEVVARTRVLGESQIQPGQDGWLQLALSAPVAVVRGDRFIIRRPSPGTTLGGGRILDPYPGRKHRRFHPGVVERLRTLAQGTPADLLLQALSRLEPTTQPVLLKQSGLDETTANLAMAELETSNQIIRLGQQLMSQVGWQQRLDQCIAILGNYHQQFPLRLGVSREELRSRLRLTPTVFNPLVDQAAEEGLLAEAGVLVYLPSHEIKFSPQQESEVKLLMEKFGRAGVASPSVKEAKAAVGNDIYFALIDLGLLFPVSGDVVYARAEYESYTDCILAYIQQYGHINAAQARDLLGTSRKYAISLLEHLDEMKLTRRVGDDRQLVS